MRIIFNKNIAILWRQLCSNEKYTTNNFRKVDAVKRDILKLYENVVAQILTANGSELFYHTIKNEVSRHNYEVDFLITRKNKICPIEVKSSSYKTHKSLDAFSEKYSSRILNKYLIYTKDLSKDADIFCLPVYLTQFI